MRLSGAAGAMVVHSGCLLSCTRRRNDWIVIEGTNFLAWRGPQTSDLPDLMFQGPTEEQTAAVWMLCPEGLVKAL